MKINNKKEYWAALIEQEGFLERGFGDLTQEEDVRLAKVSEAINEYEELLEKEEIVELTERYWIEATDRTDFVINIVQILLEHPCIVQTPELLEKMQKTQDLLFEVYQGCSSNYS